MSKKISVANWPRTAMLREAAELIMQLPGAAENGHGPQPWMDDPVKAATRERWRDFILAAGLKKIDVEVPTVQTLQAAPHFDLEPGAMVDVPISSMLATRQKEIAASFGLVQPGEKINRALTSAGDDAPSSPERGPS
eukprot:7048687-Prymnesium_polylepis.1